jgi:hypothetical protein
MTSPATVQMRKLLTINARIAQQGILKINSRKNLKRKGLTPVKVNFLEIMQQPYKRTSR